MPDPTSIAFGVIGLAGAFNNAVNCFRFVRFGQNFENDFKTHLLQLELAKLRLTRWGKAIVLSEITDFTKSEDLKIPENEVKLVTETLNHIVDQFDQAEKTANKMLTHELYDQDECLNNRQKSYVPASQSFHWIVCPA
jgi:hypothetical protein